MLPNQLTLAASVSHMKRIFSKDADLASISRVLPTFSLKKTQQKMQLIKMNLSMKTHCAQIERNHWLITTWYRFDCIHFDCLVL